MTVFERWGRFIHRHRLAVIPVSLALVLTSLWALTVPHQFFDQDSEVTQASQADSLVTAELPGMRMSSDVLLVFSSQTLTAEEPAFRQAMEVALAPLAGRFHVAQVVTPYTSPGDAARRSLSPCRARSFSAASESRCGTRTRATPSGSSRSGMSPQAIT